MLLMLIPSMEAPTATPLITLTLLPGTYTIAVRDANGCVFSTTANVNSSGGPTDVNVTPTDAACGQDNGSLSIGNVTGGDAPYAYSINGGTYSNTTNYTNLAAGTYTIAVRDANGCVFSTTANVNSSGGPTNVNVTPTDAACGQDNGSLSIGNVTGGDAPYAYSINGGNYSNTTNYTNLAAGTYTIAVRDANGCVFSTTANVNSSGGPTNVNVTPTDAACGQDNGSLSIGNVTGGDAPYAYSINGGNYSNTTNYTNLAAGTYTIAVRDANGCVFSTTANVNSSGGPTNVNVTPTDAACGQDNGSLSIGNVTGGDAPYAYSINGGNYSNTTNYTNLAAGTYTIAVRDANGCVFSTTANVNSSGGPTNVNVTPTDAACGQDNGSLSIGNVTGGNAPYAYSINGGTYSNTTNYTNLAAGTYTIAVRDANGCVFSTTANVNSSGGPTDVNVTPTDAACGQDNGSLSIGNVTGGDAPYAYSINGGNYSNTTNYTNLAAGTYTIAVRDANGCVFSTTANVNSSGGPTNVNVTPTDAACGQDNGSLSIGNVTGGDAPYAYSINGGTYSNTTNYTNLAAGTYTIAVRDANGCVFSTTANVNSSGGPTNVNVTPTDAACGQDNGSLSIGNVTGGDAPYAYSINGGTYSNTTNYTNLAAGTYTIAVRDANGCVFSTTATINSGGGAVPPVLTLIQPTCAIPTGTVTVTSPLGAQYTYSINGTTFQSSPVFNNLPAGSYTITVNSTAAGSCQATATTTINTPAGAPTVTANTTQPTCFTLNGSITVTSPVGAQYTYSIDGTNFQSSPVFNDLPAGSYTVSVVNSTPGSCNASTTVNITLSGGDILLVTTNPAASCGYTDLTSATIITGSDAGLTYTYWLDPEGTIPMLTPDRVTMSGTYYIKATSVSGCSAIKPVTIVVNPEIDPDVSITASSTSVCNGSTIIFTATTINEGSNPIFEWKLNGAKVGTNSNTFSSNTLKAGDIVSVTLTSNAACAVIPVVNSNTITLDDELVTPSVTIISTSTSLCNGATILFTAIPVNGGTNPSYQWKVNGGNVGTNSNTFSSNTLNDGDIITVVMTSNAGCTTTPVAISNEITMTAELVTPSVSIKPLYNSSCEGSLVTFTATPLNGGTAPSYHMEYQRPAGRN